MRPGLPVEQVLEAGVGVEAQVMRGNQVLATDVPIKDVSVDWTEDSKSPESVKFTSPLSWLPADPIDPLNNFGQRVQIVSLMQHAGQTVRTSLGWFQIASWDKADDGVKVTAAGLWQVLIDNPMNWPSSPPAGATVASELRRLCSFGNEAGLPVILDGVADSPVDRTLQWGTDRAGAVTDLCAAYGLACKVQPDGYLHVFQVPDGARPVAHYTARDLLLEVSKTSTPRRPNRWTVTGGTDGQKKFHGRARHDSFPFEPAGYGIVNARSEVAAATSQAQVDKAAVDAMKADLYVASTRSFEMVTDPRIEGSDVISVVTEGGEPIVGRVTGYSMSLDDPSSRMRVDVEELQW